MEFDWSPLKAVNQEADRIRESYKFNSVCDNPPRIKFNGHTISRLTYIPMGVDYILREILKNSFRSVIESSVNSAREMKPIEVTIAVNTETFTIRISDRGKGIEPEIMDKIWRYYFTTFGRNRQASVGAVGDLLSMSNERSDKELAGYGIGLPMAKAYAEYLGGSLEIKTMVGIGTDVYLTLKHIDSKKGDSFRI
jgi:[3-methyl-2-oxobutanoate dehydrogenase (acetyl-transferring)] kinase